MHVLWLILKIIGIILLVVVGLLLAVVLLLLFVPLRYQMRVAKPEGKFAAERLEADAEVSWLLRLVRLKVSMRQKTASGALQVAFLTLKRFRKGGQTEKAAEENREEADSEPAIMQETSEEADGEPDGTQGSSAGAQSGRADPKDPSEEADSKTTGTRESSAEVQSGQADLKDDPSEEADGMPADMQEISEEAGCSPADEAFADPEGKQRDKKQQQKKKDREQEKKQDKKQKKSRTGKSLRASVEERISHLMQRLCDGIQKLFDLFWKLSDKADETLEKAEAKIDGLQKKADMFTDAVAMGVACRLLKKLKNFLRHIRLRKARGYIHFGTGRADLTGQIGGILSLLLPSNAQVELIPDFYDAVFDADLSGKGHIRFCHLVWIALSEILHKDTRIMLRRLKKKKKR